jgi:Flp pilus assembly protein TadD
LLFLQGQIEDDLGHPTDAFYLYQRAAALNPTDPGPWFELGRSTLASGDVVPAVVELRTALALQPTGSYAGETRRLLSGIQGGAL